MFRTTPHGPGGPGQAQGKASQAEGSECLLHLGTTVPARWTHLCAQLCGCERCSPARPSRWCACCVVDETTGRVTPIPARPSCRGAWSPGARVAKPLQVPSCPPHGHPAGAERSRRGAALSLQGTGSFLGPVWVLLGCPGDSGFPLLHCLCRDSVYLDGSAGDRGHGELRAAHGDLWNGVLSNRSAFGRPHPRLRAPREGAQGGTTGFGVHGDQRPCIPRGLGVTRDGWCIGGVCVHDPAGAAPSPWVTVVTVESPLWGREEGQGDPGSRDGGGVLQAPEALHGVETASVPPHCLCASVSPACPSSIDPSIEVKYLWISGVSLSPSLSSLRKCRYAHVHTAGLLNYTDTCPHALWASEQQDTCTHAPWVSELPRHLYACALGV